MFFCAFDFYNPRHSGDKIVVRCNNRYFKFKHSQTGKIIMVYNCILKPYVFSIFWGEIHVLLLNETLDSIAYSIPSKCLCTKFQEANRLPHRSLYNIYIQGKCICECTLHWTKIKVSLCCAYQNMSFPTPVCQRVRQNFCKINDMCRRFCPILHISYMHESHCW